MCRSRRNTDLSLGAGEATRFSRNQTASPPNFLCDSGKMKALVSSYKPFTQITQKKPKMSKNILQFWNS